MKMKKWLPVIIVVLFFVYLSYRAYTLNEKHHEEEVVFSSDIMIDGDHYKIKHPVFENEGEIYLALNDIEEILPIKVVKSNKNSIEHLSISYRDNTLYYHDKILHNETKKEYDTPSYIVNNGIVYLPKSHIEKFLGLKVNYYYDEKTATIAIMTPDEQKKSNIEQNIGSTIFIHKEKHNREKYEPRNGIYIGGYVLQDEYINKSMVNFNSITNKKHISYFKYVGYGKPFPKEWVEEVKELGGFPHIAWEPNNGLEEVKDNEYLRNFARDAKASDVPILLRYASEMNGTWTFYSGNEELYIEKWRLVHDVMEEETPNVMMLWNVFTMPENTISAFYPGDEYVDYVGVNIYNVMYHNDKTTSPSHFEDPLRLLDYVYNTYSFKKPIVIGEFGATNYTVTDGLYHTDFAVEKISRLYKFLPEIYPRVKMIYYFDVNNLVNAPEGRKINNYAITEDPRILNAYKEQASNNKFLSNLDYSTLLNETFTYRDFLFTYNKKQYADKSFFTDFFEMKTEEKENGVYTVNFNNKTIKVNSVEHTIDKASFFEKRTLTGLPINDILEAFSIQHDMKEKELHIYF